MKFHELQKIYGLTQKDILDKIPDEVKDFESLGPNTMVSDNVVNWVKDNFISKEQQKKELEKLKQVSKPFELKSTDKNFDLLVAHEELYPNTKLENIKEITNISREDLFIKINEKLKDVKLITKVKMNVDMLRSKEVISSLFGGYYFAFISDKWRPTCRYHKIIEPYFNHIYRVPEMEGKMLCFDGNKILYIFLV